MPRNFSNIKSLLHFDFPYQYEDNSGLLDEVSSETWTRSDGVKFVGTEQPCDEIKSGFPKFGYRCFYSSNGNTILTASNNHETFSISKSSGFEFAFFINPSGFGNILVLTKNDNAIFSLSLLEYNKLSINGQESTKSISLNSWQYIVIRFSGGKITLFVNGSEFFSVSDSSENLSPDKLILGGFVGAIDEFSARAGTSNPALPASPIQADYISQSDNLFGTGELGDVTFSTGGRINCYAMINSANQNSLSLGDWTNGSVGTIEFSPKIGSEVFIHVSAKKGTDENLLGKYSFRHINNISGSNIILDKPVDEFSISDALNNYYVQIITVPNFKTLTINQNVTINPLRYSDKTGGGIIIFRSSENTRINGNIISYGFGRGRDDSLLLTHSKIISNFVLAFGGNIFIASKKFSASDSSRIGHSGDGSNKGGISYYYEGHPGGNGYGGGGAPSNDSSSNLSSPGTDGVVGYGGGGGILHENIRKTPGGNPGTGGPFVALIAQTISVSDKAISTGGYGAPFNPSWDDGKGGGGCGFCYIACKELV